MADYALSNKADEDLTEIYSFSYHRFGEARADAYLIALEECFSLLAEQPLLGRSIELIRADYLRYEHASHTIFYKRTADGILVIRVLHQSMDPGPHL